MNTLDTEGLASALDQAARLEGMSGAVSLDIDGDVVFARAYGFADRAHEIPNTTDTRFALASMSKGFTALAVASLVTDGVLRWDTPVRSILNHDLPLIDDAVTVEHLMTHTSGIGDYLDEEDDWDVDDYVLTVPVHELSATEAFLPMLDGHAQKSAPGETFSYNNGGFMVLALIAERASGRSFHELIDERVFTPAGLTRTGYLRLDELPGDCALGYLHEDPTSLRTNVLHLPVRGNGDGGAFSTTAELSQFWRAFADGRIVDAATRDLMITPRSFDESEDLRYGIGFYLDLDGPGVQLMGYDAGVSAWTRFDPGTRLTSTVISNTPEGAWKVIGAHNRFLAASA
ncbi:beta-lactamase family protein [Microbacterium lacus]|uniref:serine hydrolase domain-containing protein n=1 Tax=Microbacterium lacus TaxID=415217 RepID=UPI00384B3610